MLGHLIEKSLLWPHTFVPCQLCKHLDIEYNDLTMTHVIAGYCFIILHLCVRLFKGPNRKILQFSCGCGMIHVNGVNRLSYF